MADVWVVGDVHGHREKLLGLLRAASLVDTTDHWTGGEQELWFLGDYFDRGPDGIGVIELIMSLETQAPADGGRVGALIGNHDVMIMAARRFGTASKGDLGSSLIENWRINGGQDSDMQRIESRHVDWLVSLPAMALVDDRLLAHADATFYKVYGRDIESINRSIAAILQSEAVAEWNRLLGYFAQRRAFSDRFRGKWRAERFLRDLGGRQFVHGHTPIARIASRDPSSVTGPYVYASGLCVNVDPGMYMGGPGFAARLSELG